MLANHQFIVSRERSRESRLLYMSVLSGWCGRGLGNQRTKDSADTVRWADFDSQGKVGKGMILQMYVFYLQPLLVDPTLRKPNAKEIWILSVTWKLLFSSLALARHFSLWRQLTVGMAWIFLWAIFVPIHWCRLETQGF